MTVTVNIESPTWKAIEAWAKSEIARLHIANEQPFGHEQTQHTRGEIARLRALLELGERQRRQAEPVRDASPPVPDYA